MFSWRISVAWAINVLQRIRFANISDFKDRGGLSDPPFSFRRVQGDGAGRGELHSSKILWVRRQLWGQPSGSNVLVKTPPPRRDFFYQHIGEDVARGGLERI